MQIWLLKDLKRMAFFGVLQSKGIWLFANCRLSFYLQFVIQWSQHLITRLEKSPNFSCPSKPTKVGFVVSGFSYNLSACSVNSSSKNLIAQKSKFSLNETRCVIFNSKNDTSNVNDWQLIAQKTTNEKLPGSRSGHCARVPPANTYID